MNRRKKEAIARWVDALAAGRRPERERVSLPLHFPLGMDSSSMWVDGTVFATVITNGGQGNKRFAVSLVTPPLGGLHAAAYLRRLCAQRGVLVRQIPWRAINAAAISDESIEVIDATNTKGLFAFPDTLIRAQTRSRDRDKRTGRRYRTAYFLSGIDRQEWRESYFLCELPPGVEPTTVAEAYEALKPEAVKDAEKLGLKVRRQGDIFAIEAPTFEVGDRYVQERTFLLNTNHVADEATLVGSLLYARGAVRHRPTGRRADHRTLQLGKRWHIIVKNTVPLAK